MNRKKLLISLAMVMLSMAGLAADNLPALRVQGKNLVDANGKTVVLHGVMDTPNRYFNGWRWQQWKADYSEADIQPCLEYFSKQFSAITDKKQGAYCTVFRLHMDPCWTNDPSKKAENEADISAFNMARYRLYLQKLYIPLIKDAIAHGLYVIVRPPGVCPGDISVGDKYNRYLKAIWKAFAADEYIKQNEGVISIELANEPVRVHLSDGTDSEEALHDYFQPVVDVIREQGFKGIIWVPGAGYQSQYQDYVKYPITDSEDNFSYAVHVYSGWYGNMTDKNYDHDTFIRNFKSQVPMVETKPIMVTEIDWSPEDPDKASEDQYSKGQWAPSLKYYQGKFYLHFIAFNHEKFADGGDFLLTATDPEGEWKVQKLNGFYYDSGLFFDEATGRRFVVAGYNEISVTELDENFNAIGSSKRIINKPNSGLEGSHMYHIGDYYYIYATYGGGYDHSQTIFRSKNPFGPYEEHDGLLFDRRDC